MKKMNFLNVRTILSGMIAMLLFSGINLHAQTVTMWPSDDAVVFSENPEETASFLHDSNILANKTEEGSIHSYVKFDISGFAHRKIKSADFSTRGTAKTDAETVIRLRRAGTGFTRDTTSWENRAGVGQELATKIYTTSSARTSYELVQTRLVDYINEELAKGSLEIGFAIDYKSGTVDGMNWIGGKGDGPWGPELVMSFENEMVFFAADDASAFKEEPGKTAADAHTGNLFVEKVDDDTESLSFVKFELKGMAYKKITDAIFSTRGTSAADKTNMVQLRKSANANFSRDTTNWNNKPGMSGKLASKEYTTNSGRAEYVNVGNELINYINSVLAQGKEVIPFGLQHDGGDLDALGWMGGKNDGTFGPMLVVTPDFAGYTSQPLSDAVALEDQDATPPPTNLLVSNVDNERAISYLKFDISGFAGRVVNKADLSIRGSMPAGETMVMKLTRSGDDFTREDITWDNKPSTSGELATLEFFSPSQNVSFVPVGNELINYINQKLQAGASVISFAIEYKSGDTKVNWIGGVGDGEGYRPILSLEFDFGGNLRSFADAVADQANPDDVWAGHASNLKVDGTEDAEIRSFVKFNIGTFAGMEIIGAEFSTRGATASADDLTTVKLTESGTDFARETTTWNNKPDTGAELAAKEYDNSSARRPYINDNLKLVDYINNHTLQGKSELAFGLAYKSGDADKLSWIGGFGDAAWGPELVLQVKRPLEGDTIFVLADAFVSQENPEVNYGDAADMGIRKSGNDTDLETLLKFDISEVANAVVGEVSLTARIAQHDSGDAMDDFFVNIYAVENTEWEEMDVTWNNKPTSDLLLIEENVTWYNTSQNVIWTSEALTHYLNNAVAEGRDFVSFVLKGKNETDGKRLWMAGREWQPLATSLIFDYTVAPPAQKMLSVADSYVSQVEGQRDTNYGSEADQHLINDDANEASKWIYFKYDISKAYQESVSATLNVYGSIHDSATSIEEFQFAIYPSANVEWQEDEITWNNKPDATSQQLLTGTVIKGGRWLNLTSAAFTSYINQAIDQGRDYVTLVAKGVQPTPAERAWLSGREWNASYITLNYEPEVALPVFSPTPGTYISSVNVNIASTTANASIYYTTDGTDPSEDNGTLFVAGTPIELTQTTTIKAIAYADELKPSGIVSATYTLLPVGEPQFSPTPLVSYQQSVEVTISVEPAGSIIRYSDDGGAPTTVYDGPILLTEATTIRAQAYNADFTYSTPIVEAHYDVVETEPAPGVGPAGVGFADLSRENQPELGLWLRAHDLTELQDGDKVMLWSDISGNENHAHNDETAIDGAIPNTGENWKPAPTWVADGLNGWPALHFGSQFGGENQNVTNLVVNDSDNLDGGAGISIFLVVKRNQMFADFASIFSKRDVRDQPAQASYILEMDGGANPNKMQFVVARDIFLKSIDEFNDQDYYIVNTALNSKHNLTTFITNGELKSSALYQKAIQNTHASIIIGGFQPVDIAEIILFNSDVNNAQTKLVKTYLAAKYGLSGVQGVYYSNADYVYDIIGVGKTRDIADSDSESHTFSYGGGLQISTTALANDGDFIVAGHNGAQLSDENDAKSWTRFWNVETSGDGGNVTLGFNFDAEGITSSPSTDYSLWYKVDDQGTWTNLEITPAVADNMLNFAVVDIQDGIYALGISEPGRVGIDNQIITENHGFKVYPNPAKDRVVVELYELFTGKVEIHVRDIYGRLISSESFVKDSGVANHEVNLSGLNTGTYMIEVRDKSQRSVKLIMIK